MLDAVSYTNWFMTFSPKFWWPKLSKLLADLKFLLTCSNLSVFESGVTQTFHNSGNVPDEMEVFTMVLISGVDMHLALGVTHRH